MKKEFYVELTEEYNKEGVCVKREIGGVSIPNDEHPSVEFLGEDIKYATSIQTTKFLTPAVANKVYGYKIQD